MSLRATVVDDVDALEPHLAGWDALALRCSVAYGAPGWVVPWWRHTRAAGDLLRVVLVHDGNTLVGVGPYFVDLGNHGRTDYRLLGSGVSHNIRPLAEPGRDTEVAAVLAATLAGCDPPPALVTFEGVAGDSPWPGLIRSAWPGRVRPGRQGGTRHPAAFLHLESVGYEEWFKSRSKNFRQQLGRWRRNIERAGGEVFLATAPADVEEACASFPGLHLGRWEGRGGSSLEGLPLSDVLRDVHAALGPRLRLWCVRLDGRIVSVQVFVAAGRSLCYWSSGWDESVAQLKPSMVTILAAIEDGYARGEDSVDFGGGDQDYKLRFAGSADAAVLWDGLIPLGPRYVRTRAELAPRRLRQLATEAAKRLPEEHQARLRRVVGRGG